VYLVRTRLTACAVAWDPRAHAWKARGGADGDQRTVVVTTGIGVQLVAGADPVAAEATRVRVAPVADGDRVKVIDVLRGVALLGILLMNVDWFGMPDYFDEAFVGDLKSPSFWTRAVISVVFEGKMRALFGMLFGAGLVLFVAKKVKAGGSAHVLFYRRMLILILMGLFHAHVLLWHGEILFVYGVCGCILYLLRNINPRILVLGVPIVGILGFALGTLQYQEFRQQRLAYVAVTEAREHGAPVVPAQEKAAAEWEELEKTIVPNRELAQDNTRKMKGSYSQVASRVRPIAWMIETKFLLPGLPDSLALMLLGVALVRLGFFDGKWRRVWYRRLILVGYGVGLPLAAYSFYWSTTRLPNHEAWLRLLETTPVVWVDLIYPFQRILLVMAHASAIILLFQSGVAAWLFARLAAVGQMALTNYLMQSVLCTLFFYGYGLNLFAELQYYQAILVVMGVWILQLGWSKPWLERFYFGPAEWLWRAGTYVRWPQMARAER
jgi:uncharacterized protein